MIVLKYCVLLIFLIIHSTFAGLVMEELISKGKWFVDKVDQCPDPDQYKYNLNLQKRKVNRTHDGFSATLDFDEEVTEDNSGFALETCKKMDGGCKLMHIYEDDSLCRILTKYGKENFARGLINMGVEPHCPIPVGNYLLSDFMFDHHEMPAEGMVGSYEATVWATHNGEKAACIILHVTFISEDDLDDKCDDGDDGEKGDE